MRIDTDSKNYNAFRAGLDFAAFTGGCVAVDSVFIPMIMAVFDKKFKFLRPIGYLGTWAFSVAGGALATSIVDDYANAIVERINMDDKKEDIPNPEPKDDSSHFRGIDIPSTNASRETEKKFIDDLAVATTCFEFDTIEEAKSIVENTISMINTNGYCSLATYFSFRNIEVPERVNNILLFFGWTKDDISKNPFSIDPIFENKYLANLLNYRCIDDVYLIYANQNKEN